MAWSVDRLGRSLQDLIGFLSELHALRIDLFLHHRFPPPCSLTENASRVFLAQFVGDALVGEADELGERRRT